jgi:hypothetical protein
MWKGTIASARPQSCNIKRSSGALRLRGVELSRSAAVVWLSSYSDLLALEGRGEWRTDRRPSGRRLVRWPACSAA